MALWEGGRVLNWCGLIGVAGSEAIHLLRCLRLGDTIHKMLMEASVAQLRVHIVHSPAKYSVCVGREFA